LISSDLDIVNDDICNAVAVPDLNQRYIVTRLTHLAKRPLLSHRSFRFAVREQSGLVFSPVPAVSVISGINPLKGLQGADFI
jgi:hypothetical protein